jgi:hypothetical protein
MFTGIKGKNYNNSFNLFFLFETRWRKLSGIDPDKASLLSKVQSLQKYADLN